MPRPLSGTKRKMHTSTSIRKKPAANRPSTSIRKKPAANAPVHSIRKQAAAGKRVKVPQEMPAKPPEFSTFLRVTEASHDLLNGCWKLQEKKDIGCSGVYKKFSSDISLRLSRENKWCFVDSVHGVLARSGKASPTQTPQDLACWMVKRNNTWRPSSLKVVGFVDDNAHVTVVSPAGEELLHKDVRLETPLSDLKEEIDEAQPDFNGREGVPSRLVRLVFKEQVLDTVLLVGSIGFEGQAILQGVFTESNPCVGCANQLDSDEEYEAHCEHCERAHCGECDFEWQCCGGTNENGGCDVKFCGSCDTDTCKKCEAPICAYCAEEEGLICESCRISEAEAYCDAMECEWDD